MTTPRGSNAPADPAGDPRGRVRVGVDTGGTFTDFAVVEAGLPLRTHKVASTPDDPGRAIRQGLEELGLLSQAGPVELIHGTTVALNALLTGRGTDRAALVTNAGFLDLVEIERQARPSLYDPEPERPAPLVPRERRFEIGQRSAPGPDGVHEERRPTQAEIEAVCDAVRASGATSVAVCLLHSYADAEPERRVAAALRARGLDATASADLVGEYRESERFSTAVVNAALVPVVRAYLEGLAAQLPGNVELEVLQSSGGGLGADRAALEPARVLLSGPAGGVVGAARAARSAGLGAIVTLDMGGTSSDVAFHDPERGLDALGDEVRVAGHAVGVPTLDMHTIGCGGGSLARRGPDGALRVGPESAGADPGPIAFGRGGTVPTVTDAYVVLGRIPHAPHAEGFLGGALELCVAEAEAAFAALGASLGTDAVGAAEAVVRSANAAMRRALGVMTMQRGRDPRRTPLVAFGGGGGLAAADLVLELGLPCALVPDAPGVLSAVGMTAARRTADRSATWLADLADLDAGSVAARVAAVGAEARAALGALPSDLDASFALRYRGQSYELALPGTTAFDALQGAFARAHHDRFGWTLEDHPIELVHVRARATERRTGTVERSDVPTAPGEARIGEQRVRSTHGDVTAPVLARPRLRGPVPGPALVVDATSTIWVPAGFAATPSRGGLLLRTERRADGE